MPRRMLAVGVGLAALLVACGNRADPTLIEDARRAELAAEAGPSAPRATNAPHDAAGPGSTNDPAVARPQVSATGPAADPGDPAANPTTGPQGPSSGSDQGVDTRFAPPGGNGGATDVGVTETEIVIGNVADITGAVAGLFADVQKAAQAHELYFDRTEGTIYGREINLALHDTQLTRNGNFNAYTELCNNALMAVASMSAFDEGVEEPVRSCGIPDLRTVATNPAITTLPTMYSGDAVARYQQPVSEYLYWAETYPDSVTDSAWLFIDNNTTREQTGQVIRAIETIGWSFVNTYPADLAAISYKTEIRDMKDRGVRTVLFTGAYQQAAKLAREMVEEAFTPDLYVLQANLYDPRLVDEGAANLEAFPTHVAAIGTLVEEIDLSPELQLYREWLHLIDPDAEPTGLGMYAWSAMRLTIKLLKDIGPNVTREAMLDALSGVQGWTSNGLVPPQDVGARKPADCTIILGVTGGAFQRIFPAERGTYTCRDTIIDATP